MLKGHGPIAGFVLELSMRELTTTIPMRCETRALAEQRFFFSAGMLMSSLCQCLVCEL